MGRYGNSTVLLGLLTSGATVTIELWKLSDGSSVTLDSNACTEIGSTGIFRWSTSNIETQPTEETEYVYKMVNSGLADDFHLGKFALKCPECYAAQASVCTEARLAHIDADVSSRSSHSAADVDTELSGSHGAGSWAGDTKEDIRIEMDDNSTKLALLAGIDTDIDGIVADLDNPDQYKADISTLKSDLSDLKKRVDGLEVIILQKV